MADYTVSLTDVEQKSMEYCAADVQEWIDNVVKNRARIAKEEIIAANTKHCNDNGIAIAVGEEAQVQQAYDLGVVSAPSSGVVTAE